MDKSSSKNIFETYDDQEVCIVTEGLATIEFHKKFNVFYNPIQEFNRDISVLVINAFSKLKNSKQTHKMQKNLEYISNLTNISNIFNSPIFEKLNIDKQPNNSIIILEGLAASGIRSIRYAKEVKNCYKIIANDLSKEAVDSINVNIIKNAVDNVIATQTDAISLINIFSFFSISPIDVIDIDPYGSAAIFIDSAVRCISEGGLLCITCTDMASLCGNYPETTFARYFSVASKSNFCHEMALRILLYSIDLTANRYKKYIVPLLSISVDFYIRVFVRVFTSASEVKKSLSKKSYVGICNTCNKFDLYPIANLVRDNVYHATQGPIGVNNCEICGGSTKICGPIWYHNLHDANFIDSCLDELNSFKSNLGTFQRIEGLLNVVKEELVDCPFYYVIDDMFSLIRFKTPPQWEFLSAIIHAGYRVSYTHCKKCAFKSDAPSKIIWAIIREYYLKENNAEPIFKIGNKDLTHLRKIEANFTKIPSLIPNSMKNNLTRFQVNPTKNWGPLKRAKTGKLDKTKK